MARKHKSRAHSKLYSIIFVSVAGEKLILTVDNYCNNDKPTILNIDSIDFICSLAIRVSTVKKPAYVYTISQI